jgi:uncharacterized membrane protein YphA (DoxX/SURF4 family)
MNFINNDNVISKNIHWLLRLTIAGTFFVHGYPKLGGNLDMGFIGYLVGPFEFLGALFVLIGPFTKDILTRVGGAMFAIIMAGAIYLHLFKWGDALGDVEWQMLLLAVSLFFLFKGDEV